MSVVPRNGCNDLHCVTSTVSPDRKTPKVFRESQRIHITRESDKKSSVLDVYPPFPHQLPSACQYAPAFELWKPRFAFCTPSLEVWSKIFQVWDPDCTATRQVLD